MNTTGSQITFTDIITALQASNLQQKEKDQLFIDFSEIVLNDSLYRLVDTMDGITLLDFQNLLDQEASEAQLRDFIVKRVPHAATAVRGTMHDLLDDILAVTSQ